MGAIVWVGDAVVHRYVSLSVDLLLYITRVHLDNFTCGTSKLIAAIRTVSVAITHPSIDDTSSRATVEAVGCTGRGTRGHSVRSSTTYKEEIQVK